MLLPRRKKELLLQAAAYAARLDSGAVSRAELMPVVNVLFRPGDAWDKRLARARQLTEILPESWVGDRSNRARPQLRAVREVLREVFRQDLAAEELRFLLGWLVREVHIRDKARQAAENAAGR